MANTHRGSRTKRVIKNARKNKFQKKAIHREQIKDTKFMTGPLKKLAWTDWCLGVSAGKPEKIRGAKFKLSERYNVFLRKNLFGNDFRWTPAIYEIGAMLPGIRRKRVFPLTFRPSVGFSTYKGVEPISLLYDKKVREEAMRILGNKCTIYMRRGVLKKWIKDPKNTDSRALIKLTGKYLEKFDYAWRNHENGRHRKLTRNKIVLSDDKI